MKTEFKNVIHLYIGCSCITPLVNGKGNVGAIELTGIVKGRAQFDFDNESTLCEFDEIMPLLRDVSDISREEILEYTEMFMPEFKLTEERIVNILESIKKDGTDIFEFDGDNLQKISLIVLWFTSKQFDVFGLIASEQAIKKVTSKS